MENDILVYEAGTVKALPGGRLRGPVILFGDPKTPDLVGDYFTADTDFWRKDSIPVIYQHGMDARLKSQRLATAEIDEDEFGLWAEYQLNLEDKYQRYLYERAKEGKMAHSSGAVGHLVERVKQANGTHFVKSWPLGELSLTPEPAEPRMIGALTPLKSITYVDVPFDLLPTTEPVTVPIHLDVTVTTKTNEPMDESKTTPEAASPVAMDDLKALMADTVKTMTAQVDERLKAFADSAQASAPVKTTKPVYTTAINTKTERGASFEDAFKHWAQGDDAAMKEFQADSPGDWGAYKAGATLDFKASNATTMTAGTDGQGGAAVGQGHINRIIARKDDVSVASKVGVTNVPGTGLTTHLPIDSEANGIFISTAESAANDMDSPAMDSIVFTLAKFTKRVPLTQELLQDESSGLLTFIEDFVGRGLAKLHNNLLITAVGTSGTSFTTTASSIAVAFGEIEDVLADNDLSNYLDNAAWVTTAANYWGKIAQVTSANNRMYTGSTAQGMFGGQAGDAAQAGGLLGYPVFFTSEATALGAQGNPDAKFLYFGDWSMVGVYNDPAMRVLRDPYSLASRGITNLHYYTRVIYKVIQAEAIGYAAGAAS